MGYVTVKVHEDTRHFLRIIAAITGEQMVQVLDRLCRAEAERVIATWPEDKLLVIHGPKREGKAHVERFITTGSEQGDTNEQPGESASGDAGDGGEVAGDDAV